VTRPPWEYLFLAFNSHNFPDLFYPTWVGALGFLAALVLLYLVQTRRFRGHPAYLELYEWLLWTGLVTFNLLWIYALFVFDFVFVLATEVIGLGLLVWIRFVRFPPILASYEAQRQRERYFAGRRSRAEATIRVRGSRRRRRG
jgi:hypothetical protein